MVAEETRTSHDGRSTPGCSLVVTQEDNISVGLGCIREHGAAVTDIKLVKSTACVSQAPKRCDAKSLGFALDGALAACKGVRSS